MLSKDLRLIPIDPEFTTRLVDVISQLRPGSDISDDRASLAVPRLARPSIASPCIASLCMAALRGDTLLEVDDREKRLASPAFAAATKAILMELDKLEARKDANR